MVSDGYTRALATSDRRIEPNHDILCEAQVVLPGRYDRPTLLVLRVLYLERR